MSYRIEALHKQWTIFRRQVAGFGQADVWIASEPHVSWRHTGKLITKYPAPGERAVLGFEGPQVEVAAVSKQSRFFCLEVREVQSVDAAHGHAPVGVGAVAIEFESLPVRYEALYAHVYAQVKIEKRGENGRSTEK